MPVFPAAHLGIEPHQYDRIASLFGEAAGRAARRHLQSQVNELSYAVSVIHAFVNDRPRRFICTAGIDKFTIMDDGAITPCYLVGGAEHHMGSATAPDADTTPASFAAAGNRYRGLARDGLQSCRDCWASDWCLSCYGPGYLQRAELGAPGGLDCKVYQAMIEATLLECARRSAVSEQQPAAQAV